MDGNTADWAVVIKNVAKKRIVRIRTVAEREPLVGGFYRNYSEPASEPCVRSAA